MLPDCRSTKPWSCGSNCSPSIGGMPSGAGPPETISEGSMRGSGNFGFKGSSSAEGVPRRCAFWRIRSPRGELAAGLKSDSPTSRSLASPVSREKRQPDLEQIRRVRTASSGTRKKICSLTCRDFRQSVGICESSTGSMTQFIDGQTPWVSVQSNRCNPLTDEVFRVIPIRQVR